LYLQTVTLEVFEDVTSDAFHRMMVLEVKARIYVLSLHHRCLDRLLVQIERILAEDVTAEILRQLRRLAYLHDKVDLLVKQIFRLIR